MTTPIRTTSLPFPILRHGKVRDVYEIDADRLLLVATDRVSAFDVVLDQPVPHKGAVLTQLTAWWLSQIRNVPHHMITADASEIVSLVPALRAHRDMLQGRAMLSRRANVFPVECVVRAYLSGSGWKDYVATGKLAGEALPAGMVESQALPEPRFTPATKAESGHDENISRSEMSNRLGAVAHRLEELSLELFRFGSGVAERAGLILADTKFEFGERDGEVILIDEVMTPDSSRFWARDSYRAGTTPPSFDKQPLRDYLQRLRNEGKWNGDAPGPNIPPDVITAMSNRYLEAYRRLTGSSLSIGNAT
ncbi:MAG TPA: phosphoribosylaminoimidazolesuccinocarboxamide synthase [Gemmatimonadaceae bacterium]|nr:phosphoribosylaminoimidazolesuccinocarboxamide synthase [Gemmatimonadaceae bacterium]